MRREATAFNEVLNYTYIAWKNIGKLKNAGKMGYPLVWKRHITDKV